VAAVVAAFVAALAAELAALAGDGARLAEAVARFAEALARLAGAAGFLDEDAFAGAEAEALRRDAAALLGRDERAEGTGADAGAASSTACATALGDAGVSPVTKSSRTRRVSLTCAPRISETGASGVPAASRRCAPATASRPAR
jgi:hypothetical protein